MAEDAGTYPAPYEDRSTGLILIGILEICVGLVCLLFLVGTGFSMIAMKGALATLPAQGPGSAPIAAMPLRTLVPGLLLYFALAVFFVWMGIGTIRARRWAGTLMLIASWGWLAAGVVGTIFMAFVLPRAFDRMAALQPPPAQAQAATAFAQGCLVVVFGLFFVLLPAVLVLFYRGRNVRATFAARDPRLYWTERCPPPVLALVLLFALSALGCLACVPMGYAMVFGRMVGGVAAVAVYLGIAIVAACLVPGLYRLRPWAWWALVAVCVFGVASSLPMFFGKVDWQEMYRRMGTPPQAQIMAMDDLWSGWSVRGLMIVSLALQLSYIVWIRKYFVPRAVAGSPAVPPTLR